MGSAIRMKKGKRTFIIGLASLLLGISLCSCADAGGQDRGAAEEEAEEVTIRFAWWGNEERARRTVEAVRLFEEKNPGIRVKTSSFAFDDYGENMRIAAGMGNLPDVFVGYVGADNDYMEEGLVECLDPYVEAGTIRTEDMPEQLVETGRLGGRLYGLSLGCNVKCLAVDEEAYEKAGLAIPKEGYPTWEALEENLRLLKEVTGKYGGEDPFDRGFLLEYFVRQNGEILYAREPGRIGFSEEVFEAFYARKKSWIQEGLIPPYEAYGEERPLQESFLARGEAAVKVCYSNQLQEISALSGKKLRLILLPGPHTELGTDIRPGHHICMSSQSSGKEAAARLIDFLLNDVEANRILGVERGIPASEKVRAELAPGFTEMEQEMADIVTLAESCSSPASPAATWDTYAFEAYYREVEEDLMYGYISEREAYERLRSYEGRAE